MGGLTNPFSVSFHEARVRRFMVAITYNYVIVSSYFYAAHASSVRPCTPPKFIFSFFFGSLHLALCSLHSSSICTFSLGGNRGTELEQRETLLCRNFVIFPLWSVLRVWVWWKIERKSRTFPENIVRAEEIIPVFELWMMDRICFFYVK